MASFDLKAQFRGKNVKSEASLAKFLLQAKRKGLGKN